MTLIQSREARLRRGTGSLLIAGAGLALLAACNSDQLMVPNYNNPTPAGIAADPIGGLQLAANGIIFAERANWTGWNSKHRHHGA